MPYFKPSTSKRAPNHPFSCLKFTIDLLHSPRRIKSHLQTLNMQSPPPQNWGPTTLHPFNPTSDTGTLHPTAFATVHGNSLIPKNPPKKHSLIALTDSWEKTKHHQVLKKNSMQIGPSVPEDNKCKIVNADEAGIRTVRTCKGFYAPVPKLCHHAPSF